MKFRGSNAALLGVSCLLQGKVANAYGIRGSTGRERLSLNDGWHFWRSETNPDGLIYDYRPETNETDLQVLKPWILPSANSFISNLADVYQRPPGNPGGDVSYVQGSFDDSAWETVNLPHDWAIKGPFYTEEDPIIGGGMGRLPVHGIGWYRKKLSMTSADAGRNIYLEVDGAMSYAMVWLNGNLVGGWPYGYNSFRLDLTPYLHPGDDNQLAIRLDNPPDSARWYPGGGIYRNVWLTKVDNLQVAQWGTFVSSREVSAESAIVDLTVQIENLGDTGRQIELTTGVHLIDATTGQPGAEVVTFPQMTATVESGQKQAVNQSVTIENPMLWGPWPVQSPALYVATTNLHADGMVVDTYETRFGIRSLIFDPDQGLLVNGEHISVQGVNQHHDLGALGAAFNVRAAQRQLEILQELGCNAIRMSHNPPAPELLELTDQMGFLVMDEIFDSWELNKTDSDFHLIFPDWHEPDLRAFIRRDRNHPSIIAWSYGNEVGEQNTNETGAAISQRLHDILHEEDPTRPSTVSINSALPSYLFPRVPDLISLNYQGAGIRNTNPYSNQTGIRTMPMYPSYHETFPDKMIWTSESASTLSTRGTYIFPVTDDISAPVNDTSGGNSTLEQVSAYELYTANFGSSPDKVFASQDSNPYVAGEFVWTGWDYIGEPTPYYSARSSYSGIIDLAGFKKDRFYLYQSRWRPDFPMAHILPHWNWPDRVGQVTPVHVFSAADEAELFLNGRSQGRKTKEALTYRFRFDDVVYEAGEVHVVTYKTGQQWVTDTVRTTGAPAQLQLIADRSTIAADGLDLSFVTLEVIDDKGEFVRDATNAITFSIEGPGEIVATDNGDPADMVSFPSLERNAYSGLALAIVRGVRGGTGTVTITATAEGLAGAQLKLELQ